MERLGLGYAALKERKSDIIYCAISGFGQDGPLKFNPAYDQIIQGLCGVMSVTGDEQSAPLRVGYPVADTMGGITAAFAIAAALFRRERSGEGEFIDVSMLEATLVAMGWAVSNWLIAGVRPQPMGNENMTASPSGTFRTGDGLLNIAANKQEQFETLCRLIGREDLDRRSAFRRARGSQAPSLRAQRRDRDTRWRRDRRGNGQRSSTSMVFRRARCSTCRRCSSIRRSSSAACSRLSNGARGRSSRAGGAIGLPARERRSGAGVAAADARRRHRRYPGRARLFAARHRRARAGRGDMSDVSASRATEDTGRLVVDVDHRHEAGLDPLSRLRDRGA